MRKDRQLVYGNDLQVPAADPERCVHAHAESAACRRCIDACPHEAWVINDDELGIDAARCDGCGLCVAHCPEAALSQPTDLPHGQLDAPQLNIACTWAPRLPGSRKVPCINAIGLGQLAAWYRAGLRSLVLRVAECETCSWNDKRGLLQRLARWNRLLEQRGLPLIAVDMQQSRETTDTYRGQADEGSAIGRRAFLRRLLSAAEPPPAEDELSLSPSTSGQPTADRGSHILYAPLFNIDRCTGCDACIRICPHHALYPGDNGNSYQIHADLCSGCCLCVDVCDREAIIVIRDQTLVQTEVVLYPQVCTACGVQFHPPRPATANMPLCHVCSTANHHKKLFQVL